MTTGIAKSVAATAGAIAAFVPIGRCPACFASATGVAGSIGLSGPASSPWFLLLHRGVLVGRALGNGHFGSRPRALERRLGGRCRSRLPYRGADRQRSARCMGRSRIANRGICA